MDETQKGLFEGAVEKLLIGDVAAALHIMKKALTAKKSNYWEYEREDIKLFVLLIERIESQALFGFFSDQSLKKHQEIAEWVYSNTKSDAFNGTKTHSLKWLVESGVLGRKYLEKYPSESDNWLIIKKLCFNDEQSFFRLLPEIWLKSLKYDKLVKELREIADENQQFEQIKHLLSE